MQSDFRALYPTPKGMGFTARRINNFTKFVYNMVKICALSDLHGFEPDIDPCDLLIVAGDCTSGNSAYEWSRFFTWFMRSDAKNKVLVGGNHDNVLHDEFSPDLTHQRNLYFRYLLNSSTDVDGLKIWGSPCTPIFDGVNKHFSYFMYKKDEHPWDQIPDNIDILVTHGPPKGILDQDSNEKRCGCSLLLNRVKQVKPKIHIFGHIHQGYGVKKLNGTHFYNVAINDEYYIPCRKPTYIEL